MSGLRFIWVRLTLSIATMICLAGCCSTCPSISGRFSNSPLPTDSVNVESGVRVVSPIYLQGALKTKMDERGRTSGCGEFFWSSWYNDGPEHGIYQRSEPCDESDTVVEIDSTFHPSSKPSHQIINSRRTLRLATAGLDDEI